MGFVTDVRTGAYQQLQALQTALGSSVLAEVRKYRPESYALGGPIAFVDAFRGAIQQTTRLRSYAGSEVDLVFILPKADNAEWQDRADVLVDGLLASWPVDGHFVENAVGEPVRVRTAEDVDANGISFPAVIVTIGRIAHLEAR